MTTKNLYQRLNQVMLEVDTIYKETKKVNGQYTFVSHDAVSSLLHMPLANAGIHMTPTLKSYVQDGNRCEVTVQLKFINIDNPVETETIECIGYGIDAQDKGPGKAMSYAIKTALLKMFMLEAGEEDNEVSFVEHKPKAKEKDVAPEIKPASFTKPQNKPTSNGWN